MMKKTSHKKYRLVLLMLAVVIPGLIISGFGFLSISQQEKAKELKIREKYSADLERIRQEIEHEIESAVKTSFQQLLKNQIQLDQTDSIQQVLKDILLKNPIIKYPFLIDSKGEFIFPFSKKTWIPIVEPSFPRIANKKIESCYREGEQLEFRERKIWEALKFYTRCLKYPGTAPLKPYIFNSIARCYFKLGKYPQALSYYQSIIDFYLQVLPTNRDFSIYFPTLRQMARTYQRLGRRQNAVELYLQLYDKILQYEVSNPPDKFAFFKNEALEYINQYKKVHRPTKGQDKEKGLPAQTATPDRFREFSGPEISLRWQYFEYEDRDRAFRETEESVQKNKDILRFLKIREFYLAADEKTQFYQAVKYMKEWEKPREPTTLTREMETKQIKNPVSNDNFNVVFKRLPNNTPTLEPGTRGVFFGFQLFPGYLDSAGVFNIFRKHLREPGLRLVVMSDQEQDIPFTGDNPFRFSLLSANFEKFFIDKKLVLVAGEKNYFTRQARREIRLNYLLMGAFILVLIFGVYLFYKYLSREAELVRLKSEFTDSASHTLKTPLTRIRMLAEKLQLGWVSSESKKQEYLRTILTETDRMTEMIVNMLDFSKIEAGRKHYSFEETSLARLVKETLESYTAYIQNLGFQLQVEIDDSVPPVPLDADAIKLIVVNLLQNAVKYSAKEKFIGIRLYREGENAVLEVEDKGLGIAVDDLKKIFERFYRASGNSVQMVEGSGLGLYLVQHAVHAHNGEIKVSSQPGKGSRFKVLLPLCERV
jgi:signal transduction histidine kinase/arsenate reductase-like glutaredoxin family protein